MFMRLMMALAAFVMLGTTIPANAQQGDRGSRYEQGRNRGEIRHGRPGRDQIRHRPGRYGHHARRHDDRRYRGQYYNNGRYYHQRYRYHGGWRYR